MKGQKTKLGFLIVLVALLFPWSRGHAQEDSNCDTDCQNINALRETISKQAIAIDKLKDTMKALTTVTGVPEAIHPVPFKKASLIYSPALVVASEGGAGGAFTFAAPTVLSENNWDWASDDVWTLVHPPAGSKVYAHLTLSLTTDSHWSPCFSLRRRNREGGELKVIGKTIELPCYSSLGRRDTKPASMSVWVEWWNTDMTLKEWGKPSQTLEITGKNFGSTGASPWTLRSLEIELYHSMN